MDIELNGHRFHDVGGVASAHYECKKCHLDMLEFYDEPHPGASCPVETLPDVEKQQGLTWLNRLIAAVTGRR